jgi:ElaB/YqjD/DUF883 family membrane-anchored ribosome-binding protein
MSQRRDSLEDAPMRAEMAQLRADIDGLIGTVGRLADTAGDQFLAGARRGVAGVHEHAGEVFDTALAEGRRTLKTAGKTIESHPYLSLAIAAGIGLLLGKLIASRE